MTNVWNQRKGLKELQKAAHEYNERLIADYPAVDFGQGGDLFLGKHYCRANRVFLSLNPGGEYRESFKTDLLDFNFWDRPNDGEPNFKNCNRYLNQVPELYRWISMATVAFCVPWRTPNGRSLEKLNSETKGRLFEYAGSLVRKLINDHQNAFPGSKLAVIVTAKKSLEILASPQFLNFDLSTCQNHNSAKGIYQWSKVEHQNVVLYQIPHFSRANSNQRLKDCAEWLASDLGLKQ